MEILRSPLFESIHQVVSSVSNYGVITKDADWGVQRKENTNVIITLGHPCEFLHHTYIPKATICNDISLMNYVDEVVVGTMDWAIIENKQPYTYHNRIFGSQRLIGIDNVDQFDWCAVELQRNPDSNRAVISISRPCDLYLQHRPCLQTIQFKIVNRRLHMTTYWRSRDAMKALYMNMFAMCALGKKMANILKVPFIQYTDITEGMHIYEQDWAAANKIVAETKEYFYDNAYIKAEDFWIDREQPFVSL